MSQTKSSVAQERPGVVERAFQIARSGAVANLAELHKQLAAEDYTNSFQSLAGRSLAQQLSRMIAEGHPARTFTLFAPPRA